MEVTNLYFTLFHMQMSLVFTFSPLSSEEEFSRLQASSNGRLAVDGIIVTSVGNEDDSATIRSLSLGNRSTLGSDENFGAVKAMLFFYRSNLNSRG